MISPLPGSYNLSVSFFRERLDHIKPDPSESDRWGHEPIQNHQLPPIRTTSAHRLVKG